MRNAQSYKGSPAAPPDESARRLATKGGILAEVERLEKARESFFAEYSLLESALASVTHPMPGKEGLDGVTSPRSSELQSRLAEVAGGFEQATLAMQSLRGRLDL